MSEVLPLLGAVLVLFVVPIILIVRASRARLWLLAGLWFLSPLVVLAAVLMEEMARKPGDAATRPDNVQATIGFAIGLGIIPWAIIWLLGMAIALMLRRRRKPQEKPVLASETVSFSPSASPPAVLEGPPPSPIFQGMTTPDLHQRIADLAKRYGWPERLLPVVFFPDNDAPFVHVDHQGFHMAFYDRGQASGQRQTQDMEEMFYWVADQVTFHMSSEEVARSITHHDQFAPRLLVRQDALLAEMNPEWHRRWLNDTASPAAFYRRKIGTP